MGQFDGKRICGKPAFDNFIEAIRPDREGQCPEGYTTCQNSQVDSLDNIICVEDEYPKWGWTFNRSVYERCPINDMQIVKKSEVPDWEQETE